MRNCLKKLKTVVGRVWRDVEWQQGKLPAAMRGKANELPAKTRRLLTQEQKGKNKLYSLHAPDAECISNGKSRQPCGVEVQPGTKVYHPKLKRDITQRQRRDIRRRSAIEPAIGHMKNDGRLRRNGLKGTAGDAFHARLCGCGHKLRMILKKPRLLFAWIAAQAMQSRIPMMWTWWRFQAARC